MNEISTDVLEERRTGLEDTGAGGMREKVPVLVAALMGADGDGVCSTGVDCS